MARVKLEIDKSVLVTVINEVEKDGPFSNMTLLYQAVADTDWARNFKPKSPSFSQIGLRVKEYNIETKTKPGKRGGGGSSNLAAARAAGNINRKSRAEKFASNPAITFALKKLTNKYGSIRSEVDKIVNKGSMKAAVALKCFDCAGGSTGEVSRCPVYDCPLWAFRPWKNKSEVELRFNGNVIDDVDETDSDEVEDDVTVEENVVS